MESVFRQMTCVDTELLKERQLVVKEGAFMSDGFRLPQAHIH
jgi:hypothetical protein